MSKPLNPELLDDDNPEWTEAMINESVRFGDLPASLQDKLRGRGKQKSATKVSTTVRFDPDVLAAFKAGGAGWQTRMNDALKEWLREHAA